MGWRAHARNKVDSVLTFVRSVSFTMSYRFHPTDTGLAGAFGGDSTLGRTIESIFEDQVRLQPDSLLMVQPSQLPSWRRHRLH